MIHPARARRRVRAARDFVSPEAAGTPIYLYREGEGTGASGEVCRSFPLVVVDLSRQKICKI